MRWSSRGESTRPALAQAGDGAHPPAARAQRPTSAIRSSATEILQQRGLEAAGRASRTGCTFWRDASCCRIRAAARSMSPPRCRPTCSSRGTCSAWTPSATTRSKRRRRNRHARLIAVLACAGFRFHSVRSDRARAKEAQPVNLNAFPERLNRQRRSQAGALIDGRNRELHGNGNPRRHGGFR